MEETKTDKYWIKQQDNLEFMKELESESIDLIYCDILYNTNKSFADYEDKLGTPQQAIEWYRPRLIEMKRLLKQTGSIYLQCDYRLVHYLKVEMDSVFGLGNFKNDIVWSYKSGGSSKQYFNRKHDNILFYSKSKNYIFNTLKEKSYLSHKYGFKGIEEYFDEVENKWYTLPNMRDVWEINIIPNKSKTETIIYQTQKPKALLERIIKASSNDGDVVADFFMGSGTTGDVALELGRKFIGCDIGKKAYNITKQRLEDIKC